MLTWLSAHWLEVLGFGSGLITVWLAARRNVWNFPIGLANNLVFFIVFVGAGLYASAALQVVFGALAIHGWYRWVKREENEALYVARTPRRHVPWLIGAFLVMAAVLAWVLATFTDSEVALADAAITSASLVAQYLLNRKRLESWYVWIGVDIAFVALTASQGLWITSALYAIFIGLATYGWRSWLGVERAAKKEAAGD